ncbi:MAG: hypothetical protein ACPGJR_08170 [Akkermansiaceae bacterium]
MQESPPSLAPFHFRDLADGIQQFMFFWGQDVLHPAGNLLGRQGFERSPSTGIKGTSCYRLKWQGGHIELYGSVAGWYGNGGGFTFIRPKRRCVIWRSSEETPVPGDWQERLIEKKATRVELYEASKPFLNWFLSYEDEIFEHFGPRYRESHYRMYDRIPKNRVWLPPSLAMKWFRAFRYSPETLVRPRQLLRDAHG